MAAKQRIRRRSPPQSTAEPQSLSPEAQVRAVSRTCRGPLKEGYRARITKALTAGKQQEARTLEAEGRTGCGQDVNDLIVAGGFDGEEHTVPCPRCGQEITYRAPSFG